MNENPWWITPAMIGISAIGGALVLAKVMRGQDGPVPLTAAQREEQQRQEQAAAITSQMRVDQIQPYIMVSIPVMVGLGAFLLWKSRQTETEYEGW